MPTWITWQGWFLQHFRELKRSSCTTASFNLKGMARHTGQVPGHHHYHTHSSQQLRGRDEKALAGDTIANLIRIFSFHFKPWSCLVLPMAANRAHDAFEDIGVHRHHIVKTSCSIFRKIQSDGFNTGRTGIPNRGGRVLQKFHSQESVAIDVRHRGWIPFGINEIHAIASILCEIGWRFDRPTFPYRSMPLRSGLLVAVLKMSEFF